MTARPVVVRRGLAELIGTAFLTMAVVGSGIAAARLSPGDVGLQLLENSTATGVALVALITALQPVSASFNPVVTLAEAALRRIGWSEAGILVGAQLAGAAAGCVLANLMFDLDPVALSTRHRADSGALLAEVVATAGLVLLVFAVLGSDRTDRVAVVVGGYIAAAYWFTSSTSFANPAVTAARALSDTFAGIAPASVAPFVAMQVVGGCLGVLLARVLHPLGAAPVVEGTDR